MVQWPCLDQSSTLEFAMVRIHNMRYFLFILILTLPTLAAAQKSKPHFWIDSSSRKDPYEQLTDTPKVIISSQVVYPEKAKKQGIEGSVSYSALIDTIGNIEKIVMDCMDAEIFGKAVIDSVMKCKFTPGKVENRKVKVWTSGEIRFTLTETVVPPVQH